MSTGNGNDTKRCFTQHAPEVGPPLIQNGQITFQAHDVGWIVASIFTILATLVSFWLISKHLAWYTKKRQQRYIVRLLFMVPIYATVSLASYIFWNHAIPITLVRDSYESFVLYSFFYLLLQYISPTLDGQKEVFRKVKLQKWMFPLSFVKYRPDGLHFLQLMKWGVLQYCIVRPGTTVAAVITDFIGLYCDNSWSPAWGHIYITTIVSISVTVAMYCLIQLYVPIASQLSEHKPLLKLFSVKAVVFLTFWQSTLLSLLSMFGVVKDTPYMTANDINTGIAAILETFEMACFAFLHIRAFSYLPYKSVNADQTPRLRSLAHVIDIRDMWREMRDGSIYMGKSMRGVETDEDARRRLHFAEVMGRERYLNGLQRNNKEDMASDPQYRRSKDIYLSDSHDRFGADFQDEVEKELSYRNLSFGESQLGKVKVPSRHARDKYVRDKVSWWRGVYQRVSQTGNERDIREHQPSRSHYDIHSAIPSLDSPPPSPSIIFDYSEADPSRHSVRRNPLYYEARNVSGNSPDGPATPPKPVRVTRGSSRRIHDLEGTDEMPNNDKLFISSPPSGSTHDIVAMGSVALPTNRDPELLNTEGATTSARMPGSNAAGPHLHPNAPAIRPDSVLDRLFIGSPPSTVAGFTSSGTSQDTHTTLVHDLRPEGLRAYQNVQSRPLSAYSHNLTQIRETSIPSSQRGKRKRPQIVLPAPLSSVAQSSHQQHIHVGTTGNGPIHDRQRHLEQALLQEKDFPEEVSGNYRNLDRTVTAHHMSPLRSGNAFLNSPNDLPSSDLSFLADNDRYPVMTSTNIPGAQQHQLRRTRGDVGLRRDSWT